MAAGIIVILPLASKIIGYSLKKAEKSMIDKFWIGLSTAFVIAFLVALAILREAFFEASQFVNIRLTRQGAHNICLKAGVRG